MPAGEETTQALRRICVTGGSGFVGGAVLRELLERGIGTNALVHRGRLGVEHAKLTTIAGSLFDPGQLEKAMTDCTAAIHLVGIIAERPRDGVTFERIHIDGTAAVVEAARRAGVRRLIHMSAVGARPDAPSRYHQTKWRAEQHVRESSLDWTIIRPSMIHGPGGEFTQMALKWARRQAMPFIFMPYFGTGLLGFGEKKRIQPVFVDDVARAFVDATEKPQTIGKCYELGGPEAMTWPEFYQLIASAAGRSTGAMPIPAWYASLLTCVAPAAMLPFNRDQVLMSQEDNIADIANFVADFGWTPRSAGETIRNYASGG